MLRRYKTIVAWRLDRVHGALHGAAKRRRVRARICMERSRRMLMLQVRRVDRLASVRRAEE